MRRGWAWAALAATIFVGLLEVALHAVVPVPGDLVSAVMSKAHGANNQPGTPTNGSITAQGYNLDKQTTRFRAGLTIADSNSLALTLSSVANVSTNVAGYFGLNGRPTCSVSCRFQQSSTNTCKVRLIYLYCPDSATCYVIGMSQELTATATAIQDQGNTNGAVAGYFVAPDLVFDGHGATHVFPMLTSAPSGGGGVDFWVGSY